MQNSFQQTNDKKFASKFHILLMKSEMQTNTASFFPALHLFYFNSRTFCSVKHWNMFLYVQ